VQQKRQRVKEENDRLQMSERLKQSAKSSQFLNQVLKHYDEKLAAYNLRLENKKQQQLMVEQQQGCSSQQKAVERQNRQRLDEERMKSELNERVRREDNLLAGYKITLESKSYQKPMMEQKLERTDNQRSGAIKKQRVEKGSDDGIDEPSSQESRWLENYKHPNKNIRNTSRQITLKDQGRPLQKSAQTNERAKTYGTQPKNGASRTRTEAVPNRKYDSDEYDTRTDPDLKVRRKPKQAARKDGPGEVIDLAGEISSDSEAEREEIDKVKSAKAILSLTQTITGEAAHLKVNLDSLKGNPFVACTVE
jgi:hypothetical protein